MWGPAMVRNWGLNGCIYRRLMRFWIEEHCTTLRACGNWLWEDLLLIAVLVVLMVLWVSSRHASASLRWLGLSGLGAKAIVFCAP